MLHPPDRAEARLLYRTFVHSGYTEEGLFKALGSTEPPSPHLRTLPRVLDLTRAGTPFDLLVHLFFCSQKVSKAIAERVMPDGFLPAALSCGLLTEADGDLSSTALVVSLGRLLVAADPYEKLLSDSRFDHVLTVNPTARYLNRFTIRSRVGSAFDLGTGNGVQALALAGHADEVVGSDLNSRVVEYARFNARLNGYGNVEFVTGDSFSPVSGRTFDLIVSNPPFVLSPGNEFIYRDNEMDLDGFCQNLVRQAPEHLNEGGTFQMILEWVQFHGQRWQARLEDWFAGSGCDVWILLDYKREPSLYAQMRIREEGLGSLDADREEYDRWMAYYRESRVESVQGGLIAMRRRSGRNWLRIDERAPRGGDAFGEAILEGFSCRDFLFEHPEDEDLLATRPRLAPGLEVTRKHTLSAGEWDTTSMTLRRKKSLEGEVPLDDRIAALLTLLDGERTLADAVAEDNGLTREECLAAVRVLLANGFLLPPS